MTYEKTEAELAEEARLNKKNSEMLAAIRKRNQARHDSTTTPAPVSDSSSG